MGILIQYSKKLAAELGLPTGAADTYISPITNRTFKIQPKIPPYIPNVDL